MNIASLWQLPVIFVCEHNEYGLTVPAREQSCVENIAGRAGSYNMPGTTIDGNDVVQVYRANIDAVERARSGNGPTLIEAKTYRMTGFSTSDMGGYQPADEMESWRPKDPIKRLADQLEDSLGARRLEEIDNDAQKLVDAAFEAAFSDPYPDVDELYSPEYGAA